MSKIKYGIIDMMEAYNLGKSDGTKKDFDEMIEKKVKGRE